MKSATERWDAYQELLEGGDDLTRFALRADGAFVCFDEDGYFLIKLDKKDTRFSAIGNIYAENPDGTRGEIYCEPVWLSGWMDVFDPIMEELGTAPSFWDGQEESKK